MIAYDDTGRIKVVVECVAFAEEFGREEDVFHVVFFANAMNVTDRNSGFNDEGGSGIVGV